MVQIDQDEGVFPAIFHNWLEAATQLDISKSLSVSTLCVFMFYCTVLHFISTYEPTNMLTLITLVVNG